MEKILLILLALAIIAGLVYFIFFFKKEVNKFSSLLSTYIPFNLNKNSLNVIPEEAAAIKASKTANIGLAASGGGSRALTATLGYYRGLTHLGLMEKVRYISAVSGGAWASTNYTYLPKSIDDQDFLGGIVQPSNLYWGKTGEVASANIAYLSKNNLGNIPGRLGMGELLEAVLAEKAKYHYPPDQAWIRAIGRLVFSPYGLSEVYQDKNNPATYGKPTKYYSLNEASAQKLIDLNPSLSLSDFYLVERKRPMLIVNTSIFETTAKDATLLPVESTPLAVGIRGTFLGKGIEGRDIGGGFVPPFAFGSKSQQVLEGGKVKVMSDQRFSLSDIAGLSSSAFAEGLDTVKRQFDAFIPRYYGLLPI